MKSFLTMGSKKFIRRIQLICQRFNKYPTHLLPSKNLPIIQLQDLDNTHYLGKWVESSIPLKDPDGKLSAGAIDVKRIPGFSTNKIPGSIPCNLNIEIKKDFQSIYLSPWLPGDIVQRPSKKEYNIDNTRQHYFFLIGKLNGLAGDYENPPGSKTQYKFNLEVCHKPLCSNYWHFEFKVIADGVEIVNMSAKWKKLIYSTIRDTIQESSVFHV